MKAKWKRLALAVLKARLPLPVFVRPLVRGGYHLGVWMAEGIPFLLKLIWIEPVMRAICESVGSGLRIERLPYIRGRARYGSAPMCISPARSALRSPLIPRLRPNW